MARHVHCADSLVQLPLRGSTVIGSGGVLRGDEAGFAVGVGGVLLRRLCLMAFGPVRDFVPEVVYRAPRAVCSGTLLTPEHLLNVLDLSLHLH